MNLFEELIDFDEEIRRMVDDMLTALIAENIGVVNINSFVKTVIDMFPEKQFSEKEIKDKIRNFLLSHYKVEKILNDFVYLTDVKTMRMFSSKKEKNDIDKLVKQYVNKKLKK